MRSGLVLMLLCSTVLAQEEEAAPVVTKAPKLVQFVEAEYPPEQKEAGVEAEGNSSADFAAYVRAEVAKSLAGRLSEFNAEKPPKEPWEE